LERNIFFYGAVFLTILITVGSLISMKDVHVVPERFSDKFVHTGAYFVLTFTWLLAFIKKYSQLRQFAVIAFIVFLYGGFIEVCQMLFTKERQADVYDMLANLTGILMALLVFYPIIKKMK
jgi:VanZ family protein